MVLGLFKKKEPPMITFDQFRAMIPTNREPEAWYKDVVDMFKKYDIITPNRIAGFMAQCAHESKDFTALEENLNYSASSLYRVFGKRYFKSEAHAAEYARQPEKIANYVYMDANRSKRGALGNIYVGDGWKFRGRGIKQLTGRNNYEAFGRSVGMTAEQAAQYVATKKGALESACWFWKTNNIEQYADKDDIVGMSKRINGGTIGLDDRMARYNRAKSILGAPVSAPPAKPVKPTAPKNATRTLTKGMQGPDVARMQEAIGVNPDGIFGLATVSAVKKWQRENGLVADGIVGPSTQAKMFR